MKRKLVAILAADVVGYSRLMGEDEAGTLLRLKALRKKCVQPAIDAQGGRVVKLMGDGLLVEFSSVVDAVRCAIAIQKAVAGHDGNASMDQRIRLRIGVNLGDVIVEGSDIYGDGVNVAARLEALAKPGSICISGPTFDMVQGKLEAAFEDLGEQQMKNIAKPVRVYQLITNSTEDSLSKSTQMPLALPNKPTIAPKLELAEIERARHKPTSSLDAYDYQLRGLAAFHHWSAEENAKALDYFYRAIEIDPEFAIAHGMAARCFNQRAVVQPLAIGAKEVAEAERLARRAAALGRNDAQALCMAGITLGFVVRDVTGGAALTQRAIALNPNFATAWYSDGWLNVWLGNIEIGIEHIARAMQLSPQDPMIFQMQSAMAHAHFTAGDDSQALSWAQKALHDKPDHLPALTAAAASAALLGRQGDAEDAMARMLKLFPEIDRSYMQTFLPYQQPEDAKRWSEGFRKAGLPE